MAGLGRTQARPQNNPDLYEERLSSSLSTYNAELVPPATSYATVRTPLSSTLRVPGVGLRVGAFFKDNAFRLNGLKFNWSWGGTNMQQQSASLPGDCQRGLNGFVRSTNFQPVLVHLDDWSTNTEWYICNGMTGSGVFNGGNPLRNQYPSFRVAQIDTRTSGGPGPIGVRMQPRPRFTAVQRVVRYTTAPRYYQTQTSSSGVQPGSASSNVNTPGI